MTPDDDEDPGPPSWLSTQSKPRGEPRPVAAGSTWAIAWPHAADPTFAPHAVDRASAEVTRWGRARAAWMLLLLAFALGVLAGAALDRAFARPAYGPSSFRGWLAPTHEPEAVPSAGPTSTSSTRGEPERGSPNAGH